MADMSVSLPPSVGSLPPSVHTTSAFDEASEQAANLVTLPDNVDLPPDVCEQPVFQAGLRDAVQLPPGVEEGFNGYDGAIDDDDMDSDIDMEDQCVYCHDNQPNAAVPTPLTFDVRKCPGPHCFAEIYSVPRVTPEVARRGYKAILCQGIRTGWDFSGQAVRELSLQLLVVVDIAFVMLSPPCNAFSALNHLWNYKRMPYGEVKENC